MTDTVTPDTGNGAIPSYGSASITSDTTALRTRLGEIITRRQEQEQRLASLEASQLRANDQLLNAHSQLMDAESVLSKVISVEDQRLAQAYLTDTQFDEDPVGAAKAVVTHWQSEIARLQQVEAALSSEIDRSQASVRAVKVAQYSVMVDIVTNSKEYQSLLAEHRAAYKRLRTIKESLRKIASGLHGQGPQSVFDAPNITEPLERRVGYPVSPLVDDWATAMAALESDADAVLPQP